MFTRNTNAQFYFMSFSFHFFQVTTNPIPATLLPQQPHPPSAILHQQNLSHARLLDGRGLNFVDEKRQKVGVAAGVTKWPGWDLSLSEKNKIKNS